jgi:O-antigen/teichoic acid export membrane protein
MAAVGGATAVCQALGVVTSLVLRAALSPAQMGVWQGLKVALSYANYANLGVSKGAARELAIATGSGQLDRAQRGLNLAFTVNTLTSVIYGGSLAAAALWFGREGNSFQNTWSLGLLAMALLVVLQRHLTFHVTILRCCQAFGMTSWVSIAEGSLTLVLAGLGAWCWGLPGLYGGTLLTMMGTLLFLRWLGVQPFRVDWQWAEIKRLVAIGGPILLGGVALTVLQSLDKLMLLGFSSEREFDLGCYSTTLLITGQIYGLANMFALVISPRYAELYGHTGSHLEVAQLAARTSELLAAAASVAAILGLVVVVPALAVIFPDYRPGLPPAAWLVPGIVMLALTLPLNQLLVAICRERVALLAVLFALACAAVGDWVALAFGHGMMGVAAATALAYAIYFLLMLLLSIWPRLDPAARSRYLWTHAVLLTPVVLTASLNDVHAQRLDVASIAAASSIALSAWASAAFIVWWRGGWRTAWRGVAERASRSERDKGTRRQGDNEPSSSPCLLVPLSPCPKARTWWQNLLGRVARRPTLAELEARCQKPNYRRTGNWMARRISRPMALRITWIIAPSGVSAHALTVLALISTLSAGGWFAMGSIGACLMGALLLQVWYLLDHVDGQIARWRGSSSLDGIQLDYLMHHVVNLVLPCSLGYGAWKMSGDECWLLLGFAFASGLLLLGLANDTRYKAFMARLKQLDGIPLMVRPGWNDDQGTRRQRDKENATAPCRLVPLSPCHEAATQPSTPGAVSRPGNALRRTVHLARKLCEIHVVMNFVTAVAVAQWLAGVIWPMQVYLAVMGPLALLTSVATLARDIRRGAAEREFERWYSADLEEGVGPNERGRQRTDPEVVPPGDLIAESNC